MQHRLKLPGYQYFATLHSLSRSEYDHAEHCNLYRYFFTPAALLCFLAPSTTLMASRLAKASCNLELAIDHMAWAWRQVPNPREHP